MKIIIIDLKEEGIIVNALMNDLIYCEKKLEESKEETKKFWKEEAKNTYQMLNKIRESEPP